MLQDHLLYTVSQKLHDNSNIIDIETEVYAGRVKDKSVLYVSSSGGAFTALSDVFLEQGDAVAAAVYNYQSYETCFQLLLSKKERDKALGSKYMQSKPGKIFSEAEAWLKDNPDKRLLFVGMGCQAEGFRRFIEHRHLRNLVYIVDIVCHGSPSPKLWKEYAELLERSNKGIISFLTFKDKRNSWLRPTALVKIHNKEFSINDYVKIFYNQCALRPSCHVCPYATTVRKTDMTIGDFWHIEKTIPEFYDPQGNSLFLIHTNRGKELFNAIKEKIDFQKSDIEHCLQDNLKAPTPISPERPMFWEDYRRNGIGYIMKKYGDSSLKSAVINKLKKIIRGGVFVK